MTIRPSILSPLAQLAAMGTRPTTTLKQAAEQSTRLGTELTQALREAPQPEIDQVKEYVRNCKIDSGKAMVNIGATTVAQAETTTRAVALQGIGLGTVDAAVKLATGQRPLGIDAQAVELNSRNFHDRQPFDELTTGFNLTHAYHESGGRPGVQATRTASDTMQQAFGLFPNPMYQEGDVAEAMGEKLPGVMLNGYLLGHDNLSKATLTASSGS